MLLSHLQLQRAVKSSSHYECLTCQAYLQILFSYKLRIHHSSKKTFKLPNARTVDNSLTLVIRNASCLIAVTVWISNLSLLLSFLAYSRLPEWGIRRMNNSSKEWESKQMFYIEENFILCLSHLSCVVVLWLHVGGSSKSL